MKAEEERGELPERQKAKNVNVPSMLTESVSDVAIGKLIGRHGSNVKDLKRKFGDLVEINCTKDRHDNTIVVKSKDRRLLDACVKMVKEQYMLFPRGTGSGSSSSTHAVAGIESHSSRSLASTNPTPLSSDWGWKKDEWKKVKDELVKDEWQKGTWSTYEWKKDEWQKQEHW